MNTQTDITFEFSEFIRVCGNDKAWIMSLIDENVLDINNEPEKAIYTGFHLAQVKKSQRIRRDFNASVEATALILQLLDEVHYLRQISS